MRSQTCTGLRVEPEILEAFPGMTLVAFHIAGVVNDKDNPVATKLIDDAWCRAHALAQDLPNPQTHPRVACWRTALSEAGVNWKKHPASIEAMLRRAMKDPTPLRINPIADVVHSASLDFVVPVGVFDVGHVEGDLVLKRTAGGEPFRALGEASQPEVVEADEIGYCDDTEVHTRHFLWRQSSTSLVSDATREAVGVAEVHASVGAQAADRLADTLQGRLQEAFDRPVTISVLDTRDLEFSWRPSTPSAP